MTLSSDELKAIEARANKATAGPWEVVPASDENHMAAGQFVGMARAPRGYWVIDSTALTFQDAEFVAHARTDVPALVAEVRRLLTINGAVAAENERLRDALRVTGGVSMLAQCPVCLAEGGE